MVATPKTLSGPAYETFPGGTSAYEPAVICFHMLRNDTYAIDQSLQ